MNIYVVYWSGGKMDNPQDGTFEVQARCLLDAAKIAELERGLNGCDIDAIMEKSFHEAL